MFTEELGQGDDDGNLGQFGRLERDAAQAQPSLGARVNLAEKQHEDKEDDR